MIWVKGALATIGAGAYTLGADVNFSNTISTGVIISTAVVIVIAGLFTIRANTAKIWRESYEGEKEARQQAEAEVKQLHDRLVEEAKEASIVQRDLDTQVRALQAKTDLTSAVQEARDRHIEVMAELSRLRSDGVENISVLREIAGMIRDRNTHEGIPPPSTT